MGNGEDSCIVVVCGREFVKNLKVVFVHHLLGVGPGVVDVDLGAILLKLVDDIDHSGVADVGAVLFEGEA